MLIEPGLFDISLIGMFTHCTAVPHHPLKGAWWEVDLEGEFEITEVIVKGRMDCCMDRLSNAFVVLSSSRTNNVWTADWGDVPNSSIISITANKFTSTDIFCGMVNLYHRGVWKDDRNIAHEHLIKGLRYVNAWCVHGFCGHGLCESHNSRLVE